MCGTVHTTTLQTCIKEHLLNKFFIVMLPNPVGFSDRLPQFLSRELDQKPLPADMRYTMYGAAFFGVYT